MYPIGMFTPAPVPLFGSGVLAVHRGKLYATEQHPTGNALLRLSPVAPLPGDGQILVMPSYTLAKPVFLTFCEGQKLVYHGVGDEPGRSMVSFHPHDAPTPVRNDHLRAFAYPVGELAILDSRDLVRITSVDGNLRAVYYLGEKHDHRPHEQRYTMATLTRLQRIDRLDVKWMHQGNPIETRRSHYFNTVGDNPKLVAFRTPGTKQDFCVDATDPGTQFSNFTFEQARTSYSTTPPPSGATTPPPLPTSVQPAKGRRFSRSYPQHQHSNFSTGRPPLRTVVPDNATL